MNSGQRKDRQQTGRFQHDLEFMLDPLEGLVESAQRIPWEVFGPHFCPAQNALSGRESSHWHFRQPIPTPQLPSRNGACGLLRDD
jgi:hypothetical protein